MTTTPTIWKKLAANVNALAGLQDLPSAATFADGGFLVTWTDDANGASPGFDLFAQKFDAEGNAKGGAFQLNTLTSSGGEFGGQIVALPDGGFVYAYAKEGSNKVYLERRDATGRVVFTDVLDDAIFGEFRIAAGANGDYSVQFVEHYPEPFSVDWDPDVFGFIYDFETNARSARFETGRNEGDGDGTAGVAALAGGGFVFLSSRDDDHYGVVYGRVIDGNGALVGGPFTVGEGQRAQVTGLTNGNFAVAYQRDSAPGADQLNSDIFVRVFNPEGGASPELVVTQTANNEFIPAITHLLDGGFFIAWFDFDLKEVRGQRYDAAGDRVGETIVVLNGLGLLALIEIDASLTTDGRILLSISDGFTDIREVILDPRDNVINGTSGDDVLTTQTTASTVSAGAGRDKVFGQKGNDTIDGGEGNDVLQGGGGVDTINGGEGNDVVVLLDGHNSDNIDGGGGGRDLLELRLVAARGAGVDLAAGTWFMTPGFAEDSIVIGPPTKSGPPPVFTPVVARAITNVEFVSGTQKDDRMAGSSANNQLYGNDGDDRLSGAGGADILGGGDGDDTLDGGAGADRLIGGEGIDAADYSKALVQVSADLQAVVAGTGDALGDRFSGIENLRGTDLSAGVDRLRGDAGANHILGLAGNDLIDARAGGDRVEGGLGADTVRGNIGDDVFVYASAAEGGDAVLDFSSNAAGDNDSFAFRAAGFGAGLVAGAALAANQFEANTAGAATLATTRFVYDTDDRVLRFDANGSAVGGAVVIAALQNGATLTIDDIAIF
jgi:Ca2+-binding RTX toxin-like protein